MLNIGRLIGVGGMRFFSIRTERKSQWMGTFSNVGSWPPVGSAPGILDPDIVYIVAPPGTPNFPISVGLITWNGRLSITLKVHPSISDKPDQARFFLERLKASVLLEI